MHHYLYPNVCCNTASVSSNSIDTTAATTTIPTLRMFGNFSQPSVTHPVVCAKQSSVLRRCHKYPPSNGYYYDDCPTRDIGPLPPVAIRLYNDLHRDVRVRVYEQCGDVQRINSEEVLPDNYSLEFTPNPRCYLNFAYFDNVGPTCYVQFRDRVCSGSLVAPFESSNDRILYFLPNGREYQIEEGQYC